jgi:hypothetical protein
MLSERKSRYAGKRIVKIFLIFLFPLALISCSSALPPKSLISTPYFEVISPWDSKCYLDSKDYDVIELRRGNFGSDWTIADYPVKQIIILRRTIKVSTDDDQLLKESLKRDVLTKTKSLITEQTYGRGYDDNDFNLEFIRYKGNEYYSIVYKNHFFDRICLAQSYIYIPKYYKVWGIYYLFFYHEHPGVSYGRPSFGLVESLNGFKCIEDSLQEKQRPTGMGKW